MKLFKEIADIHPLKMLRQEVKVLLYFILVDVCMVQTVFVLNSFYTFTNIGNCNGSLSYINIFCPF